MCANWPHFNDFYCKFTKFLQHVESSWMVLAWYRFCNLPNRCGMPVHKMKTGCANSADPRHKSVIIAMSLEGAVAIGIFCYEADLPLYICKSLAKINPGIQVETMQTCAFLHVCIHALPAHWPDHKISEVTLQTFPIQRHQGHFRIPKQSWQSGVQILLFESVTDKQKQTNKQNKKQWTFLPTGGVQYPSPTKLGMVIEEVRTILAPQKHVRLRCIVSPLKALKIWGTIMCTPRNNPHNSETRVNLPKFQYVTEHDAAHKRWKVGKNRPRYTSRGAFLC